MNSAPLGRSGFAGVELQHQDGIVEVVISSAWESTKSLKLCGVEAIDLYKWLGDRIKEGSLSAR